MENQNNNDQKIKIKFGVWESVKFGLGMGAGLFLWGIILFFAIFLLLPILIDPSILFF